MPSSGVTRADDLYRFQAGLAFLLGASFADPYHAASHGAKRILVKDELDRLPTPQPEIPVQSEPALRGIHDQTGNSRLVSFEVDDQAGALPRRNPPHVSWLTRISCQRQRARLACPPPFWGCDGSRSGFLDSVSTLGFMA